MAKGNVKDVDSVWEGSRNHDKSAGILLEKNGIDDILRLLSKRGYRSFEALELQKEMEESMQKYHDLIVRQRNMPGEDQVAEAVVKYYLFRLEKLKRDLPYDAMGGEDIVPILVLQEFQNETIAEEISETLGTSDASVKEEVMSEVRKFVLVFLDPRGKALYMELMKGGQKNLDEHL